MEQNLQGQKKPTSKPHLVTVAVPLEGHRNPMIQISIRMAAMGATVTLVQTDSSYYQSLESNGGTDPILQIREAMQIDLRSAHISDGLPLDSDRKRNRRIATCNAFGRSNVPYVEAFLESLVQNSSPPVSCLVTDLCCIWGQQIASKFKISHACLNTESAAVFSIYRSWDMLSQRGHLPFPQTGDYNEQVIDYIPGLPPLKIIDLPSYLQESDLTSIEHRVINSCYNQITPSQWVLSNTIQELEPDTVSAIAGTGIRLISVGPLNSHPKNYNLNLNLNLNSFDDIQDCSRWLDSKPKNSVLYVSFGSISRCSEELLHEFAMGLMNSKQPFIWSLRPEILISGNENSCSGFDEILPKEFLQGSKDQGITVNWCSQQKILGHPSVAGFVTHCGWNSVLEGLWYGVPILCFPLFSDQYTNNWTVVEQWGAGKNLGGIEGRSINGMRPSVSRVEVCRDIKDFMAKGRSEVQSKLDWAKNLLFNSVTDINSSSNVNLKRFLEELCEDNSTET